MSTEDGLRTVALVGACAAFVVVPNVGSDERTERYDTVITPPDYAFAVWAPIFAGCVLSTVGQALPGGQAVSRATGWPLAGAYALNAAWSLAAQTDRFAATPVLLPVAAGLALVAHARQQGLPAARGLAGVTPVSTGLLAGWTTLASVVNVAAGANLAGASAGSPRTVARSAAALVAVSGAVAVGVATSRRGALSLAAAAGWGLITLALTPGRPRSVRWSAAAGASAVGMGALVARRRRPVSAFAA
ncbi:hypothetical protein [Cryptosporangium phraense]|uniref:Tryptophan-rich sensory protein n=1 Tax=Cryptosporangium phraense TaxID=2593070 RepID=A0A545AMN7_9ACTN|nr:hypothetical protein [Cryptosporangium phraense]TQS42582.1 hypothetical protein FL583_23090 [Cryptosporangium phraense]